MIHRYIEPFVCGPEDGVYIGSTGTRTFAVLYVSLVYGRVSAETNAHRSLYAKLTKGSCITK